MKVKNYYDIEEIVIPNSRQYILASSTESKYVQQIKLGILYLFGIYKGTARNKSIYIEFNGEQITPENSQIRFLPADVYYKRDVEDGANSVLKGLVLNLISNNPDYVDKVTEIYELLDSFFPNDENIFDDLSLRIDADELNFKKILGLLSIRLDKQDRELEEIDLTEYQLKMLYLRLLEGMYDTGQKIIYVIESPEAGLNYDEKVKFMEYLKNYENLIVFTNDIDIMRQTKDFKKINIINKSNYSMDTLKFCQEISFMFKEKNKEEIYNEVSDMIIRNMEKIIKNKEIGEIKDDKEKNIILDYINLI